MAGFFEQVSSEEEFTSEEENSYIEERDEVEWSEDEDEGHVVVSHLERIIGEIDTEIEKASELYEEKNYAEFLVILNSLYKKGEKIRVNLTNGSLSSAIIDFKLRYIGSTEPEFKKIKTKLKRLLFEYEATDDFELNDSSKLYEPKIQEIQIANRKENVNVNLDQKTRKRSDEYAKWYEEFKADTHNDFEGFYKKLSSISDRQLKRQVYIHILQQLVKPDTRSKQKIFISKDKLGIINTVFNRLISEISDCESKPNATENDKGLNWVVVASLVSKTISSLKYYYEKADNGEEFIGQIIHMIDNFLRLLLFQSEASKGPLIEDKINEYLTLKLHYTVFCDTPDTNEVIKVVSIMKSKNIVGSFRREFGKIYSIGVKEEEEEENECEVEQEVQYILKAELLYLHYLCNLGETSIVYNYLRKAAICEIINYALPYSQVLYNRLLIKISMWLFKNKKYQVLPKFAENLLSRNYYDLIGNSNTLMKSIKHEIQSALVYMKTDKQDIDQFITAYFISVAIINVKKIYSGKRVQPDHKHFNKVNDTLRHSLLDSKLGESNVEKLLLACIYISNRDIDKTCSWVESITGVEKKIVAEISKIFRVEYTKSIIMSIKHNSEDQHIDLILDHTGLSSEEFTSMTALDTKGV